MKTSEELYLGYCDPPESTLGRIWPKNILTLVGEHKEFIPTEVKNVKR